MEGTNFIQRNWTNLAWIAGLLFAAGGAYSEFKALHKENEQLNAEIDKVRKQAFEELEQRLDDVEEWRSHQEGYNEGRNSIK